MHDKFLISEGTKEEESYVRNTLVAYNARQVPFMQKNIFEYINFIAKNEQMEIIGGISSVLYYWGILYIDVLWVHDEHRSKGIGSQLMDKLISTAKEKGCTLAHVDTFDFQAKGFYLKQDFEIFGILEDCPPGHSRFYLKRKV